MLLIAPPPRPAGIDSPPTPPPPPTPGKGSRIWLARHGKVSTDYARIAYRSMDVPLSEEGLADGRQLMESFRGVPVTLVVSSDLDRAALLGRGIAAMTSAKYYVTKALREIDRGTWQGIERTDFRQRWDAQAAEYWGDPWNWCAHGGDSDAALFARGWAVIEEALGEEHWIFSTLFSSTFFCFLSTRFSPFLSASRRRSPKKTPWHTHYLFPYFFPL